MNEIGRWSPKLFAAFRKAAGPPPPPAKGWRRGPPPPVSPRARHLQGMLVIQNEPLIKILVAQLCGIGEAKKGRPRKKLGGLTGVELIPWEDAMQAGRIGFAKALMAFDPSKGKISYFALHKIRYELQLLIPTAATIKIGIDKVCERPACALVGEQQELDALFRDTEHFDLAEIDGLTPELIAQWRESGEWPELEEFQAMVAAARAPKVISIPSPTIVLSPLEMFLRDSCKVVSHGRVTQYDLWSAYVRSLPDGAPHASITMQGLVRELGELRGLRAVGVRSDGRRQRGVAGLRMATASAIAHVDKNELQTA